VRDGDADAGPLVRTGSRPRNDAAVDLGEITIGRPHHRRMAVGLAAPGHSIKEGHMKTLLLALAIAMSSMPSLMARSRISCCPWARSPMVRAGKPVADTLQRDGYTVACCPGTRGRPSRPTPRGHASGCWTDTGQCVLVGHSYGGMIISEVGAHPAVRSLVMWLPFNPRSAKVQAGCKTQTPALGRAIALFLLAEDSCK